jgi:hypothetical protein
MFYLYLLTYFYWLYGVIAPVTKFSEEKYLLTNSQVAELWKIESTNLNTIPILTEMRALLP